MVLDSVPADTTMVGIPARPVDRKLPRSEPHFDPYGMPCDESIDPLLRDLEGLRQKLAELEARVGRMHSGEAERTQEAEHTHSRSAAAD